MHFINRVHLLACDNVVRSEIASPLLLSIPVKVYRVLLNVY